MTETELDVRTLPKPDRHTTIFARYNDLSASDSFVLINDHDPVHLREEFEADHPGSYSWDYLESGPVWRVRIGKLTTTPLPRLLVNTRVVDTSAGDDITAAQPDVSGVAWKLTMRDRDLDSNMIVLPPGGGIGDHAGAEVDVMIHILAGSGKLTTERGDIDLEPGALLWLPRHSRRRLSAGPDGLRYLTVHRHREIGGMMPTVRRIG